jgi:peptidoglycan/LPS O-acetylase OafA/YrhL
VALFHLKPRLTPGGPLTLEVFCALSGFVIAHALWSEATTLGHLRLGAYAVRRAARVLPALLLVLAVFTVAARLWATPAWGDVDRDAWVAATFRANLTRARGLDHPLLFGHTWSVALEAQFYLLLPLVLAACRLASPRPHLAAAITAILGVASLVVRHAPWSPGELVWLYNAPASRMAAPLLGAALALIRFDVDIRTRLDDWWSHPRVLTVSAGLLAVSFAIPWRRLGLLMPALTVALALSLPLLVSAMADRPRHAGAADRVLRHPAVLRAGDVSYPFFLWHYPIFGVLFFAGWHWLAVGLVGLPLSWVLGVLVHDHVEWPIREAARRLTRRPSPLP